MPSNRRRATLWIVALFLISPYFPTRAWGWSKSFGDEWHNAADAVAALPGGDVVAYARVERRYIPGGYDEIDKLVRFSGTTGLELWRSSTVEESAGSLLVTPVGDIYSVTWHAGLSRHDPEDGTTMWTRGVAGSCGGYLSFTWDGGLAAHPSGDIVGGATGCVAGDDSRGRFTVGRFNRADGSVLWRKQVESDSPSHQNPSGRSHTVAVDAAGDVVAIGYFSVDGPGNGNYEFVVVKFDGGSGEERWRHVLRGFPGSSGEANAVAIDSQDNVVVAGTVSNLLTVCKFSASGLPLWNTSPTNSEPAGCRQQFDGGSGPPRKFQSSRPLLAAVDANNDVIVGAGSADVCTNGGWPLLLMKLAAFDGSPVWQGLHPGQTACPSFAAQLTDLEGAGGMAVDAVGDITVIGVGDDGTSSGVAKVAGDTGLEMWSKRVPKVGTLRAVAHDEAGNVLLAGTDDSRADCKSSDALVAKLHGADGAIASSCGDGNEDADEECDDGNTNGNDGCAADCTIEHGCCGDGVEFGVGEECDDANQTDGDWCDSQCHLVTHNEPPWVAYAPLVWLHPDEKLFPGDATSFIGLSRLKWSHDSNCDDTKVREKPKASLLGKGKYRSRTHGAPIPGWKGFKCKPDGPWHRSCELTRPYSGIVGSEGFFLEPRDDSYLASAWNPLAPVYYDYEPGQYLVYWFFYNYDKYPSDGLSQFHQGDWENIAIQLDAEDRAVSAVYYAHGHEQPLDAKDLLFEGSHPVVFSAQGTHASYATIGSFPTNVSGYPDHTGVGLPWSGWNNLTAVRNQPWWGYGGAWGKVGKIPENPWNINSDFTGPLGPSDCKLGMPDSWAPPQPQFCRVGCVVTKAN